jgi:hypothetical protein
MAAEPNFYEAGLIAFDHNKSGRVKILACAMSRSKAALTINYRYNYLSQPFFFEG